MAEQPSFAKAWLQQRIAGANAVAAVERRELSELDDQTALAMTDALLSGVPAMDPADPRCRHSGLVEQQRLLRGAK